MAQLQAENTTSKKKGKKKPTYRFAVWLQEGTKEPDAQIPFKPYQKRVWCRAQHSWLDVETADWISTSSYSKAFEYEDTGIIREDGKPLKRRRIGKQAVYAFLKSHQNYESTHKHISKALAISLRSVEKACEELREEGKLITKIFGKGKGRKTRFITQLIEMQKKEYLKTIFAGGCAQSAALDAESVVSDGMRAAILDAVRRVRVVGLPFRWRNKFTFVLILGLKVMGYRESVILRLFREIFLKCNHVQSHKFSEREFMQTVENAFKPKYRYCIGYKNEGWNWEGFLKALDDLERKGNVRDQLKLVGRQRVVD